MLFAFSVAPTGGGFEDGSVSRAVARAVQVVIDSGLPHETNAMFTIIEGDWDECMDVVKRATEEVAALAPRVSLVVKADIRTGHERAELSGKVQRLQRALKEQKTDSDSSKK